jgi:hypothetical protein
LGDTVAIYLEDNTTVTSLGSAANPFVGKFLLGEVGKLERYYLVFIIVM